MDLKIETLHKKALDIARKFHQSESDLLDVLQEIDEKRIFTHLGFNSLFDYAVKALKLSEANASNFITVARKSQVVPELKAAIRSQEITISKARKITPVLTKENSSHWLELARTLPRPKLEREVAKIIPQALTPEKAKYVTEDRLELKLGVSEEIMEKLKRAQDLVSQKNKKAASFEETLNNILIEYLRRNDPVEKAQRKHQRANARNANTHSDATASVHGHMDKIAHVALKRKPLSASIKHRVQLRDGGQCTHKDERGERCDQRRWIDTHHVQPISKGGTNEVNNLKLLCHGHHRQQHLLQ